MSMLFLFPLWALLIAVSECPRRSRRYGKRYVRFEVIKTPR